MNKIKVYSAMLARCEFNNASVCLRLLLRYISLFVMSKIWHQYKDRSTGLASLNSPLICIVCAYIKPRYQVNVYRASGRLLFLSPYNKISHRIFGNIPSQIFFFKKKLRYSTLEQYLYLLKCS